MRELFVYYRARSNDAPALEAAVQAMQARLRAEHPALTTRLLRRPDENGGLQTWMETYSTTRIGGVTPGLQTHIEAQALALAPLIDGPRHIEVFIACAS
jgi:Domain of unknown function (DUF4936)